MNIEQKQNKIIKPTSVYTMSAEEQNQITSELQNLITEGGITPSENDLTQVKSSVKNIVNTAISQIDLSGKANIAGGNTFFGQQNIYQGSGVNNAITISKEGITGSGNISLNANGVQIDAPAGSKNIDVNGRTVFKNITALGTITGETKYLQQFTVEGCYTATIAGNATIKLPTPTDITKENTINILLNATATSFITWQNAGGFTLNVNTCLTSFSIGKYLIRLMYDNNSAQWFGEVLKGEDTVSPVKLLLHFDGNYTDSSASPITLTANTSDTNFPVYITGKFANTQALRGYTNRYFTQSTNSKLNLGTGDFTVCFWFKTDKTASNIQNDDVFYSSQYSKMSALKLYLGTISNNIGIDPSNYSTPSDWHYIAYTRSGNNLYYFIDGVYKATKQYSGSIDFSSARIAQFTSTNGYSYIQDLLVKDTCDYSGADKNIGDSVFNPPTAPYIITDNSLQDLHDATKQNDITTITGYDASKTQILKNVQGVLTWVDEAQ